MWKEAVNYSSSGLIMDNHKMKSAAILTYTRYYTQKCEDSNKLWPKKILLIAVVKTECYYKKKMQLFWKFCAFVAWMSRNKSKHKKKHSFAGWPLIYLMIRNNIIKCRFLRCWWRKASKMNGMKITWTQDSNRQI